MTDPASRLLDAGIRLLIAVRQDLLACLDDLSLPQFRVLFCLKHDPDQRLADLARSHGVTAPAMSKLVDGLVDRGLVDRVADPDDRRVHRHRLTDAGRVALKNARKRVLERLRVRLDALPEAQTQALLDAVDAFDRLVEVPA